MSVDAFSEWPSSSTECYELGGAVWENLDNANSCQLFSDEEVSFVDVQAGFSAPNINLINPSNSLPFTSSATTTNTPTPAGASTSHKSLELSKCPCCKANVSEKDYHAHVNRCFVEKNQIKSATASLKMPKTETLDKINSIRESAAKMSLSSRIGLLESLSRLAQSAKEDDSGVSVRAIDRFTLTLLYSSTAQSKQITSKKRKADVLAVDTKIAAASPISREASTPTTRPVRQKRVPHGLMEFTDLPSMRASVTPTPKLNPRGVRQNPPMERDVVQALRFSPSSSPALGPIEPTALEEQLMVKL